MSFEEKKLIGGVDLDYVIEQCRKYSSGNPHFTEEEISHITEYSRRIANPTEEEKAKTKDLRYPGLPRHMRTQPSASATVTKPRRFFGIGWWY
ncbi:hypothetical protein ACE198_05005 [Neobacillus sp. KR4-4]|uniref:hypothetical protein n=1 Tax=Neobacillus sp. KR4-4 TaxID=3344872 RepID=UPI0035CC026C